MSSSYTSWVGGHEVGVSHCKSIFILGDSPICEASGTSKFCIVIFSLHLYRDPKWVRFFTLPHFVSCETLFSWAHSVYHIVFHQKW
jgi:hypothetical protein